ncbi:sodium/bile acid cotransporter [Thunnus maccoyii]|uniref:sodium/bile acid cotransporter n=1 Tax=Thunnus maccoyii TaxID=8240 RepID=UPI001C4AEE0F|nr:sodium/bile acid cotransporter [Thunnus maccoyii]
MAETRGFLKNTLKKQTQTYTQVQLQQPTNMHQSVRSDMRSSPALLASCRSQLCTRWHFCTTSSLHMSSMTDRKESDNIQRLDICSESTEERKEEEPLTQQEAIMDDTADPFSDVDLWQNDSFMFNMTAANTSSTAFKPLLPPTMDKIINILLIVLLFITMVSLGCTMEVSKIKRHIVKPKGVVIAVLAQYGIMPLTAFCLAKAFQLAEMTAVTVLICGCCPGGTLSNLLALALQGDMNLSIVMTSCSTLLALGMMPLLLYLYCQSFANVQNAVPYVDIIIALFTILIPCGIGILINYYRPQYSKTITKVGLSISMISVTVIGIFTCTEIGGAIFTVLNPPVIAIGALMPFIGYTFGYIISSLFKLNQSERRTVAMETGCQNTQLCATILKMAFTPATIGPLFLFPIFYLSFQLTEGVLLVVLFRCHQRFTRKEKNTYQPTTTEEELKSPTEASV